MNPTEIADALDQIARQPFDPMEFGFSFAAATDNAQATLSKLRGGSLNRSDVQNGVLLSKKFHYAPALPGMVADMLNVLRISKSTARAKPAILIATDGETFSAENVKSGEKIHFDFQELGNQFAFFLPAAGKEIYKAAEENPVDVKATGKLAKLYDALMRHNPSWSTPEHRHAMNLFMTRLIFCLFSEDVGVFKENQFSYAVFTYGGSKGEDAATIIGQAFQAMSMPKDQRQKLPHWAQDFEYVNGGLFTDQIDIPEFNNLAFRYLRDAADDDWTQINPDIFGSMIQSIADPKARSELGMHYTSVPNILKVLGPLFLDDVNSEIEKAWDKPSALRSVHARLAKIRVLDPACGSGNFLVVAYRQMRECELRILKRLEELERNPQKEFFSVVRLDQFYGIELTDFAAETAKLALFIAEYQANARFADVFGRMPPLLPLQAGGNIICGNALRLDWNEICPPPVGDEEVYIAGNPPFLGSTYQSKEQKSDLAYVFEKHIDKFAAFDLVTAWFFKASQYVRGNKAQAAFVATNSICQGQSVSALWPYILGSELEIGFAYRDFKWTNNASKNAAVICSIIGIRNINLEFKRIFGNGFENIVNNINGYLVDGPSILVSSNTSSIFKLPSMLRGNQSTDGGHLILSPDQRDEIIRAYPAATEFIRPYLGSKEVIRGLSRYCLWIDDDKLQKALQIPPIRDRIENTRLARLSMKDAQGRALADKPHQFREHNEAQSHSILVPSVSSERRPYLPVDRFDKSVISSNLNQVLYDAPDWCIALIASRLHLVWIATVCGKLKSDFRYSNTLGWNTFPVPKFTDEQLEQLSVSARRILKTRYAHYPKSIAELYDPDKMPDDLRQVHQENDELLETMYIGRPFRNDTERLEKLFKLYAAKIKQGKK